MCKYELLAGEVRKYNMIYKPRPRGSVDEAYPCWVNQRRFYITSCSSMILDYSIPKGNEKKTRALVANCN
jgi:hypothetical protein